MLGGGRLLSGSGWTVSVGALAADAEPPALAAVTRTATVLPTSAPASVYVGPEPISAQAAPTLVAPAGQRSQVEVYAAPEASHVPRSGVRVSPWAAVPAGTPGATRLSGGATTASVAAETALPAPSTLLA